MFSSGNVKGPKFVTRRALILINLQNDSFDTSYEFVVCRPQDFVDRIKSMVPYFRQLGDLIWVRTEFETEKTVPRPDAADGGHSGRGLQDTDVQQTANLSLDDTMQDPEVLTGHVYFPTSREKAVMRRASAKTRAEQRNDHLQNFANDDDSENLDAYLSKPRKGQLPTLYVAGTRGAAFTDGVLPFVDTEKDLTLIKHHYSAFDATPLLLTLRMRLVTHIYLCGCLSNVSIYATAADAVRHGFEVTVVEDCMGYRSEAKHLDAMRQMADMLGVSGIDSEEIIDEAGGQEPPDMVVPMFTGPGFAGIHPPSLLMKSEKPEESRRECAGMESQSVDKHITSNADSQVSSPSGNSSNEAASTKIRSAQLASDKPRNLVLGPNESIGEGDSKVLHSALPPGIANRAFELVKGEVDWQSMRHRSGEVPRKVAVQGVVYEDGSRPLYRHPADESPPLLRFTSAVDRIRKEVERILRQPFNHALIQLYRDGQDNISEHSDKTLDIVRGSSIVNLSLGAQRIMTIRSKKSRAAKSTEAATTIRQSQRIPLPHNSIFVLGPRTNTHWLHGIRADKRPLSEKSAEEKAFNGERISITFRHIGTFTDEKTRKIWGQGAVSKYRVTAGKVSTSNSAEMESMIIAFGKENQQVDFDWDAEYGGGFNVVNLVSSITKLYLCRDNIANLRVMLSLFERDVPCEMSRRPPEDTSRRTNSLKAKAVSAMSADESPTFRDVDEGSSEITGDLAILFYLGKFYPITPSSEMSERQLHRLTAEVFGRMTQANEILFLWQELRGSSVTAPPRGSHSLRRLNNSGQGVTEIHPLEAFQAELEIWEEYAEETEYIGGDFYTIVDCAFWPVLNEIVEKWEGWKETRYPDLTAYHENVARMTSVQKALAQI